MEIAEKKFKNIIKRPDNFHVVGYYSNSGSLVQCLTDYLNNQNIAGEYVIITSPKVIIELQRAMLVNKEVSKQLINDHFNIFNSKSILGEIIKNGLPDRNLFFKKMKLIFDNLPKNNRPLRVYGDMVASLWESDQKDAAIKLECLWNELADKYNFSLFCAYPINKLKLNKKESEQINACHGFNTRLLTN